jgi:hypothetical protein
VTDNDLTRNLIKLREMRRYLGEYVEVKGDDGNWGAAGYVVGIDTHGFDGTPWDIVFDWGFGFSPDDTTRLVIISPPPEGRS